MPSPKPLPPWKQGDALAHERLNAMQERPVTDIIVGPGLRMTRVGNSVTISAIDQPAAKAKPTFPARITSSTQDGSNLRFTYGWAEVEKTTPGYGGWVTKPGGRTGTAYNRTEDQNGATGLMGNGVDTANLVGSFSVQPAPVGLPVELTPVPVASDGTTEFWFSYENGVDGACP